MVVDCDTFVDEVMGGLLTREYCSDHACQGKRKTEKTRADKNVYPTISDGWRC
jgi:hypothetical protein